MSGISHPDRQGVCDSCGRILTLSQYPRTDTGPLRVKCPGHCEGHAHLPALWTVAHNSYGDPIWSRVADGWEGTVWEVAARPGHYQWDVISKPDFMPVASGDEQMSDSLEEAQAAADHYLNMKQDA